MVYCMWVMFKQKMKKIAEKITASAQSRQRFITLTLAIVFLGGFLLYPVTRATADQFDEQIKALNQNNSVKYTERYQLGSEASSLNDTISKLQVQINTLQGEINANQVKRDDLQRQITVAEEELARQKKLLGADIKQMYLEGQISTLEMLASSKNLSDFVDRQQYRNSVQEKIKSTLDKITELKHQLRAQKETVEKLLEDQKVIQGQLDAQKGEQNRLLGLNLEQQNALNQQIKSNNALISSLRAQQAAANRRLGGSAVAGDPNKGGYPANWANAPQDSMLDSWGMYNRECVSYTAWKVYQRYGYMPYWGGHGNANQWPQSAINDHIATGSTPREGSVAISMAGAYGHAMWVESVLGNGQIYVSQYNYGIAGEYSEMTINSSGLIYIYFQ